MQSVFTLCMEPLAGEAIGTIDEVQAGECLSCKECERAYRNLGLLPALERHALSGINDDKSTHEDLSPEEHG